MRILQVIPAFPPSVGYGGGPVVAFEISRHLILRGHDVTVVTTDANNEKERIKKELDRVNGIKVHYFKNISNYLAYHHKIFISPRLISWAKAEVKNFDIIHLHDTRTFQNIIIYYFARKYRIPYVLQPHGTLSASDYHRKVRKKLFDFFGKNIMKDARCTLALNVGEANRLQQVGIPKTKIHILPNGIDLSHFSNLPAAGEFRKKYDLYANDKVILYLGRIHKIKGLDLLIDAYSKVIEEIPCTKLVIAGPDDGALRELRAQVSKLGIQDRVLFTGPIYGEDKISAYVDCDVYVLPSIYETFPISILEACACGKPVVITNCSSMSALIDKNVGIVVPCRKVSELKDAITKMLTDEKLRSGYVANTKRFVKKFDWKSLTEKLEDIYIKTLEGVL